MKMRFKIILLLCLAVFAERSLQAAGSGTTSGVTLLQPVSGRASGLAEAYTSVAGDISSFYYNPAGLAGLQDREIMVMHRRGLSADGLSAAVYGSDFGFAFLSAGIVYYNTGSMGMYTPSGNLLKETGQKDIIFTVSGARELGSIPAGLNVKILSSEIFGVKAKSFAVDMGAMAEDALGFLDIGLAVKNIGAKITYIDRAESLPLSITAGACYKRSLDSGELLASVDIPYHVNERHFLVYTGMEYTYNGFLSFRCGGRLNLSNVSGEGQTLKLGLGIIINSYILDFSTGVAGRLDTPRAVSLRTKF